ncbi:hypothetical protein VTH06DRAFT_6306 [Thermothelomyces fergusii]
MAKVSRVILVALRIWQFFCAVIVLGILARFVHVVVEAGVTRDGRVIYGLVVASLSILFALVFAAPFMYSFMAFPVDFALFVMWLILFCLLITRTGTHTCSSRWFTNYWGFYWGEWWVRRPFWAGPNRFIRSGCSSWRTVLAFSFMAMLSFLATTFLGAYVASRRWTERRKGRRVDNTDMAHNPPTSQTGGPAYAGGPASNGWGAAPGPAPAAPTTAQTGTYVRLNMRGYAPCNNASPLPNPTYKLHRAGASDACANQSGAHQNKTIAVPATIRPQPML